MNIDIAEGRRLLAECCNAAFSDGDFDYELKALGRFVYDNEVLFDLAEKGQKHDALKAEHEALRDAAEIAAIELENAAGMLEDEGYKMDSLDCTTAEMRLRAALDTKEEG